MIELRTIVPDKCARILLKIESENPTGSMKDCMALAMITAAERDGRLKSGGNVVEYTGGSTGVSLALVCAAKKYPLHIVTSDAFSLQKRQHMQAFGAELTLVPSVNGGMDATLTRNMIETARQIRERTECLRNKGSGIHVEAVEPAESAVLSGQSTGVHKIEGIGAGFVVPLWDAGDRRSEKMVRRLAREEAILAGASTGANLVAALRVAHRLGPNATVVTMMCDSGAKYFQSGIFNED